MARARGARSQTAAAFETVYGTPPGSGFRKLPFSANSLSTSQGLLANDLLGFGRDPLAADADAPVTEGDLTVPVDVEAFGFWLKAVLGAPTTSEVTGVFTHVYTSGSWALPSVAIENGLPDVPHYEMISGAKVNSLAFEMARTGRVRATLNMMAQGAAVATATAAGTPTAYALSEFMNRHGGITRGGTDLANVVSASFTYRNNLDRIETIRDDGLIDGLDGSMADLSLNLTMRFADTTMLNQALNGEPAAFTLTFTRGADETLTFSIPRLFLPVPKRTIEGPNGVQVTFEGIGAQQADGSEMLEVTLVNSVASY